MDKQTFKSYLNRKIVEAQGSKAPIYVDVDNTLVFWNPFGFFRGFNNELIEFLRKANDEYDIEIILWSAGGAEHAKEMAKEAKIDDIVSLYLTKPAVAIDDLPFESSFLIHFTPDENFRDLT